MSSTTDSTRAPERRLPRSNPSKQPRWTCVLALVVAAVLGASVGARGDLVVLTTGDFLHVESVRVAGGKARLELPSGGVMTLSMERLARVVDDEVADAPGPIAETAPSFSLRWSEPAPPIPSVPYGELIHDAARRHGLNPELLAAVARAESAFRPDAVSPKGARGLMQLMPATAQRFGLTPDQAFEPSKALDAGGRYLRWLADRFGDDLRRVLAAYNAGEGTVDRYDGVPPYRETRRYVKTIVRHLGLDKAEVGAARGDAASSVRSETVTVGR